jgi:hypothetical protein
MQSASVEHCVSPTGEKQAATATAAITTRKGFIVESS